MFTVGQKVYVRMSSSNRKVEEKIKEYEVKSVGRKWITIASGWSELKFDITGRKWKSGYQIDGGCYSSPGLVYESREEIETQIEKDALTDQLKTLCSGYGSKFENISTENLKKAIALLKGEE
ncbi:MAG TPA: hypothetical protein VFM18_24240 [Methanosarcina sp.]|nr:hypothetical protein [Methanosarcina sp.]